MKKITFAALAALTITACSSGPKFQVNGDISGADGKMLYLEASGLEGIAALDSVKLKGEGAFSFKQPRPESPEFYRLRIDDKVINFSVDSIETLQIKAPYVDFSTAYTIEGSGNSNKIKELTLKQIALQKNVDDLLATLRNNNISHDIFEDSLATLLNNYKEDVKVNYIFAAPNTAAAYFALFQKLNNYLIFDPLNNKDDVKCFAAVATSLNNTYPDAVRSKNLYNIVIKGMKNTRQPQSKSLEIPQDKIVETGIIDIALRDVKGNVRKLTDLKGKVVLVTGAAGSIGSELCRQLCHFGLKQLVLFDSAETPMHNIRLELEEKFPDVEFTPVMGDIRMIHRVESIYQRFRPHIVFHAAAYKHVPLMEENPCEAVHTNVYGTRNVADMAVKYDVDKFIMVSTDKAVNPTNVMGASKRLAEMYVQSLSIAISKGRHSGKTRFITTRFGNVLGSNGSVIPRFREQLAKGGPLTVTHPDIIRYFMTIPEACRLVLEAAFMGKGNEIFVFDMGTPVKIADLARRMIELAGLIPGEDIEIKYTGLRPGEKLYEELLATKENTLPTENEKIYRAQVREYDYEDICTLMSPLIDLAIKVDKMGTVRMMKGIVPEFKSKNSVYEALDKAE